LQGLVYALSGVMTDTHLQTETSAEWVQVTRVPGMPPDFGFTSSVQITALHTKQWLLTATPR